MTKTSEVRKTSTITKDYYAWQGQNASTGSPHPITGRMSMYGQNLKFQTKEERDEYVEDFYDQNGNEFCVACSLRTLRGYNLGTSMFNFEHDLACSDYMWKDEEGRWNR